MNKTTKGLLLVSGTTIISGIAIFINSLFVTQMNPTAYTFAKNGIVAVTLFLLIVSITKFRKQDNDPICIRNLTGKQWLKLLLVGIIGGGIPFILFFEGLALSTGPSGAFIHKSMFIFIAILAFLHLKEKISPMLIPAGITILFGNFLLLKTELLSFNLGNILVLCATLFWSVENILAKKYLKEIHPIPLAFGRMAFGIIILLGYLLATGNLIEIQKFTLYTFAWTIITSGMLLGYLVTWYYGLRLIPVSLAALVLLVGSPITYVMNLFFKGTSLSGTQGIGIVLIMAGVGTGIWGYISAKKLSKVQQNSVARSES